MKVMGRSWSLLLRIVSLIVLKVVAFQWYLVLTTKHPMNSSNSKFTKDLALEISKYNEMQIINNFEIYDPVQTDTIIIVVQVHRRIINLKELIFSLSQVPDISEVLLIFSHDFYDIHLNELIQDIKFCKVMQIFYPFSRQLYPNKFPGEDSRDCPVNISKKDAITRRCNNAYFPDKYGHYRNVKVVQIKHHWWWKANFIFNKLNVTKHHMGLVVFLEEDQYVVKDFLHVIKLMESLRNTECGYCNVLSLGSSFYRNLTKLSSKLIIRKLWTVSMTVAFNKNTWEEIVKCKNFFCTFDDYNWDWSLKYTSEQCLIHTLQTLQISFPRVLHLGVCGMHYHKTNCDIKRRIANLRNYLEEKKNYLFPKYIIAHISKPISLIINPTKGYGGWGDIRDHNLCKNFTQL